MSKLNFFFSFLFIISACGDRTVEEYNREKVEAEYTKILPIVGNYSGLITIADSHQDLKMNLLLEADKKIVEQSDQPTATQQTVIKGTLIFSGSTNLSVSFTDGFFNPETKEFQLLMPIQRRNGQMVRLEVSGQLESDGIKGKILIRENPDDGSQFFLTRSSGEMQKQVMQRDIDSIPEGPKPLRWTGYSGQKPDRVDLFLIAQFASDEEKIVNLFSSIKFFNASLNFANVVRGTFNNIIWNTRLGILNGEGVIGSEDEGEQQISLNCVSFLTKEKAPVWNCTYLNLDAGVYFPIRFLP